jgi:hypothetical protein
MAPGESYIDAHSHICTLHDAVSACAARHPITRWYRPG